MLAAELDFISSWPGINATHKVTLHYGPFPSSLQKSNYELIPCVRENMDSILRESGYLMFEWIDQRK
jgi:hypothetical protein